MPVAVGTSLVVIAMQSLAGFAGHLSSEHIDWRVAAFVSIAAVAGALIGGRLIAFVQPALLRIAFGWFVLMMASLILAEEVGPAVGAIAASITALAATGASFVCSRYAQVSLHDLARLRHASTTS